MADTDANTTVANDEPEKKGVGFIGGAAALGAGALAATGTGSLMHKKAVEGMAAEGKETLSKATSEGVAAYKKANPGSKGFAPMWRRPSTSQNCPSSLNR
jgi:hypothetical protein